MGMAHGHGHATPMAMTMCMGHGHGHAMPCLSWDWVPAACPPARLPACPRFHSTPIWADLDRSGADRAAYSRVRCWVKPACPVGCQPLPLGVVDSMRGALPPLSLSFTLSLSLSHCHWIGAIQYPRSNTLNHVRIIICWQEPTNIDIFI